MRQEIHAISVDAVDGAALLGVSERHFHRLRYMLEFPKPINLCGPHRPRWLSEELVAFARQLPRLDVQENPEPERLALARDRKRKGATA